MGNLNRVLEFIDTQRSGPEADLVKAFAYTVLTGKQNDVVLPCSMRVLYQQLFYLALAGNKDADTPRALATIAEGAPAELVTDRFITSPPASLGWAPPGLYLSVAAVASKRGDVLWSSWLVPLAESLPYYTPATREKVITAITPVLRPANNGKTATATINDFLAVLTNGELGLIVRDNPGLLRTYSSPQPVPGLSAHIREETARHGSSAAGKSYASFAVLTAVRHDESHMMELAHTMFSADALGGGNTVDLAGEKKKSRYRMMSHLVDGKIWWHEFDKARATGSGWNALRYRSTRTDGTKNGSPRPFLQEILNRAIDAGIIEPKQAV